MSDFKAGDVVKLKSGSPKMTVASSKTMMGHTVVVCVWFDGTKKLDGNFPPEAIEKA